MKIRTDHFHVPARCVAARSVAERPRSLFNSHANNELLFLLSRKEPTHIVVAFDIQTCDENEENWETTVVPADCMVTISHGGSASTMGEWEIVVIR